MHTWQIMFAIQFITFTGAVGIILWFMYRKNDPLEKDNVIMETKKKERS